MDDVRSESWVISIKEKLDEAKQFAVERQWEKWSIYQVPQRLREVQANMKTYVPRTVSVGPHHCEKKQVQDMIIYKRIALNQILGRTGQDINIYLASIRKIEDQVRGCYQQKFEHLSSNDFVEMMVLDGCFISELLINYADDQQNGNPVFADQRSVNDILLDMVILENQVPLVVLQSLFKLIYASGNHGEHTEDKVIASILNLFNPEWLTGKSMSMKEFNELRSSLQPDDCLHILDVFRRSLIYTWPQQETVHEGVIIHRVTDLKQGGVKFRKRNSNSFWDIRFNNGVLEIPTIRIQDSTMTILLNVAAFEHCHMKITDAKIASYVVFMQCLIKSPEDVGHLHHCGIIQNILGDDAEVVDMFKSIPKEILVDARKGYYAELSEQVNAYYNHRRNRWRASLLQKHLNNPWAIISLIAASVLLILTSIQSFYAVYAYYKPRSQ